MEKERNKNNASETDGFTDTLKKAQSGDNESMQQILDILDPDIKQLSKFLRMSKEDAIQSLKVELISIVKKVLKIQ